MPNNFISVIDFGAVGDGVTNDTTAINAALASMTSGGTLFFPKGTYLASSITVPADNISIVGECREGTKLVATTGRTGHSIVVVDRSYVTISNLTIDADAGSVEGCIRFGGTRYCRVDSCDLINGDLTTLSVSGELGAAGGTRTAYDNLITNCTARGQKRYTPGGVSPFIAGDNAQRTSFVSCTVVDCVADAFDADNAPDTRFIDCHAVTTGTMAPFAGFWAEGQEVNPQQRSVLYVGCTVDNYKIGFGTSEKAVITCTGFKVKNCERAIWSRSTAGVVNTYSDGTITTCGIDNADTNGAVALESQVTLDNVIFTDTQYQNAISIYSGGAADPDGVITISNCTIDKAIRPYSNGGPGVINITGNSLYGHLNYFDCTQRVLNVTGNNFVNSQILAARIKRANISGNTFYNEAGTGGLTAISFSLDNFNSFIDSNSFIGYDTITDSPGLLGTYYTNSTDPYTTGGTYSAPVIFNLADGYNVWELVVYASRNDANTYGTTMGVFNIMTFSGFPGATYSPAIDQVTNLGKTMSNSGPTIAITSGVNRQITITLTATGTVKYNYYLRKLVTGQSF